MRAVIMQASQALNEGVRKVSDEWFKFARARIERAFEHVEAAIQIEAARDNLEGMLQSTQRIAELSQQTTNEASRKLSEKVASALMIRTGLRYTPRMQPLLFAFDPGRSLKPWSVSNWTMRSAASAAY
jgi:hypothetical protein